MYPALVSIAGPLKGRTFPVGEGELLIGRESSNAVSLNDISISRRHCLIKRETEHYKLSDLDSLNGTFVNDVPVKERLLEHGDRIRVGGSSFLFLLDEREVPTGASTSIQFDEQNLSANSTVQLRLEDTFKLMARDLHALMKISQTINALRGLEAIQQQLLELVMEVVPAERGAVLMVEDDREEPSSVFIRHRHNEQSTQPVLRVSRTVLQRVIREGVSLLSNELAENEILSVVESLQGSALRSLLCVPLAVHERVIGVVYLDSSNPAARFEENQLQLLTAVANVAAVALENARRMEFGWKAKIEKRLHADMRVEHHMIGESARMREVLSVYCPRGSKQFNRADPGRIRHW
ncbi:MAG: FHA domain-containing protein [Pyrinomonadaceae bacterium]